MPVCCPCFVSQCTLCMAGNVQDVWQQQSSRSGTPADLDVGAVVALHALDVLLCHPGRKVGIFPVGLRPAAPSGVPEYVDVWRKCIEAPADKGSCIASIADACKPMHTCM